MRRIPSKALNRRNNSLRSNIPGIHILKQVDLIGGKTVASMGVQSLYSTNNPPTHTHQTCTQTPIRLIIRFFKCKTVGESEMISPQLLSRRKSEGKKATVKKKEERMKEMTFFSVRRRSLMSDATEGPSWRGRVKKKGKIVLTRWPLNMN